MDREPASADEEGRACWWHQGPGSEVRRETAGLRTVRRGLGGRLQKGRLTGRAVSQAHAGRQGAGRAATGNRSAYWPAPCKARTRRCAQYWWWPVSGQGVGGGLLAPAAPQKSWAGCFRSTSGANGKCASPGPSLRETGGGSGVGIITNCSGDCHRLASLHCAFTLTSPTEM